MEQISENIFLRPAVLGDIPSILSLLSQARQYQKISGFPQWGEDYPGEQRIREDIDCASGFCLCVNNETSGYVALFKGDREYEELQLVPASLSCLVIHRMALSNSYRSMGLGKIFFDKIHSLAQSLAVGCVMFDTGINNAPMKRLAVKSDYLCLGRTNFSWGPRLVFVRKF